MLPRQEALLSVASGTGLKRLKSCISGLWYFSLPKITRLQWPATALPSCIVTLNLMNVESMNVYSSVTVDLRAYVPNRSDYRCLLLPPVCIVTCPLNFLEEIWDTY